MDRSRGWGGGERLPKKVIQWNPPYFEKRKRSYNETEVIHEKKANYEPWMIDISRMERGMIASDEIKGCL